MAPAGVAAGGTLLALPPPMYRQERPRSAIFVVQAVSESSSPENGAAGGPLRYPAEPQLVVPTVVVNESLGPGMVVVVVGGLTVVVVPPGVVVVVVGGLTVVVVPTGVVVVVLEELTVVVVGAAQLSCPA